MRDTNTNDIILEITDEAEEKIRCKGGKGGRGNWHFKSPTNQTPRYSQPGIPLEEKQITLELKVLADVGLVGFPNAGKSTLLSVITSAKTKIADYEFTTLKPNLGIVKYRDYKTFVMADIPGIIEGAAEGKGLGHYFLRHIERNSTLLFLIPADADDIKKQYDILLDELRRYNPEMLDKDRLIAISKCEIEQARLLTLSAADKMDKLGNKEAKEIIAMIKIVAPNMALKVIDRAIQVLGGKGVGPDTHLAHYFAIARMLRLADGPDEVHMYQLGKSVIRSYGKL